MKALLAAIIAASLSVGCAILEGEQTTTDTSGSSGGNSGGGNSGGGGASNTLISSGVWGYGSDVITDSAGNIYVVGNTHTDADTGNIHSGAICDEGPSDSDNYPCRNVFVTKFDSNYSKQWTTQFGSASGHTESLYFANNLISVDVSGNIYVRGATQGGIYGNVNSYDPNNGGDPWESFLVKFNNNGSEQWTVQQGPGGNMGGVANDNEGKIYVYSQSSGLTQYDTDATEIWNKSDSGYGFAIDSNDNIYSLAENSLTKYHSSGTQLWTQQLFSDTSACSSWRSHNLAITVDSGGNVYVSGDNNLINQICNASEDLDIYLIKFDSSGNQLWSTQFGENNRLDEVWDATTDSSGSTFILAHHNSISDMAAVRGVTLIKYDKNGNQVSLKELDTTNSSFGGITADESGGVYITGSTWDVGTEYVNEQMTLSRLNF